jgi:ABC-type phosphonate transport system ATPase subunit
MTNANRPGAIDKIVTATILAFLAISGIGKTKTRELINVGVTDDDGNVLTDDDGNVLKLETVAIGSRRLIVLDSWRRIVEYQRQHPIKLSLRGRNKKISGREAADRLSGV